MGDQKSTTLYGLLRGALGLGVFFLLAARVLYIHGAPDDVLVSVVPDDAFYYLQLAKNRAELGRWTFDGTTTTTGFHLLYAYFLAVIYHLFESIDWRTLFLIVGIIASLSIAAASYFSSAAAAGIFGRPSIILATAPYLTAVSIQQSSLMMESWLLMLLSSLTIYGTTIEKNVSHSAGSLLIGLGALGSLSRTDYGLLPFMLLLSTTMMGRRFLKTHWQKRCLLVFLGSVIGLLIATAHNYFVSGHFTQMSAQIKLSWSAAVGHSIVPPLRLLVETAFPVSGWSGFTVLEVVLVIAVIFIIRCYWILRSKAEIRARIPAITVMLGCALTVIGYILLYRHNSQGIQRWYAANLIAPIAILLSGAASILVSKPLVLVPSSVIVLAAYVYFGVMGALTTWFAHQPGMLKAGLHLKAHSDPQSRYGSWNAGIIGFFSEIRVINLDGVVNDEIYDYMKSNELFDYLLKNNIRYLVDYDAMIRNQSYRSRGGYSDSRFDRCVRPLQAIDGGSPGWGGRDSHLRIFEVVPSCS